VVLVAETSELATATRAIGRAIVLAAIASVLVMVFVTQAVVRRVTAPLDRLVAFVRGLSPGDTRQRAPVGRDEIGALADAFNGLLDRVQRFQEASMRSEKLALAGMLAARVAHDIRNPLSSIRMQTQLLQAKRHRDPEDDEALSAVLHDIGQVESVIRDLLELARPGEYRLQPTAINTVIAETLAERAPQFRHRRIDVETHLAEALPPVLMDQSRFRQALLNVLMNASEAMATGGRITVSSRRDGDRVAVEVCDDGAGVDPALVDRVFDPFVSTKPDGVGLGLVNVKAVVDGHGGTIALMPRRPSGTCVLITLPIQHG
jgi:signal transduction histidine kinase